MSTSRVLRKARRLLESGWDESLWAAAGIRTWSVTISIWACATEPGQLPEASRLLEHVALPGKAHLEAMSAAALDGRATEAEVAEAATVRGATMTLREWLEAPSRKLAEVIAALDTASLRAKMLEGVDTST